VKVKYGVRAVVWRGQGPSNASWQVGKNLLVTRRLSRLLLPVIVCCANRVFFFAPAKRARTVWTLLSPVFWERFFTDFHDLSMCMNVPAEIYHLQPEFICLQIRTLGNYHIASRDKKKEVKLVWTSCFRNCWYYLTINMFYVKNFYADLMTSLAH